MSVFTVLVSASLLMNVVLTQRQSSQKLHFNGTFDLNQLCGPLDEAAENEDDRPLGCKIRQQIYDVTKFGAIEVWEHQNESAIEEVWSRDVVVYHYLYKEPFRGIDVWTQHVLEVFDIGLNPILIEMLEFDLCGLHPQALFSWSVDQGKYARIIMQFKIEDRRWKISKEIIQTPI